MKKNYAIPILGVLFCFTILAFLAVYDLSKPKFLEVNFFDVGQGDAAFIQTPQRNQILIDGGPSSVILEKLGKLMPFWDRTINLIVLSHPDYDHISGLLEVLKKYRVENILWSGFKKDTPEFKEWEKLIKEEKANILLAEAGNKIIMASTTLEVLYRFKDAKDSNNSSIVVKLVFGENSFLFTGDIYKDVEKKILEQGIDINSDVLKVSHHGSKSSSHDDFIRKVSPKIAVISAGQNNAYGHPNLETLDILKKYDINILRTDINNDIKILCDFQSLKLKQNPI